MKILSKSISYDRITITSYEPGTRAGSKNSGYCKHQETFNRKIKSFLFLGIRILSYVAECEHVPSNVLISLGCLGYDATAWKSKWLNEKGYGEPVAIKRPLWFTTPDISIY